MRSPGRFNAPRCATCLGRKGECSKCGSDDYCVTADELDGVEFDVCVKCTGEFKLHAFATKVDL